MEENKKSGFISDDDIDFFRRVCFFTFNKYFRSYKNHKDDMIAYAFLKFCEYRDNYDETKGCKSTYFFSIACSSMLSYLLANKIVDRSYKKVFNVLSIDEPRRVDCENPGFSFSDFLVDDTVDFDRQINLKFLKSICNEVVGELVVTPKTKKLKLNWEIIYNTIKTYIKTRSYERTSELLGVSKQYVFIIMEKFRARLRKKLKEEDFI